MTTMTDYYRLLGTHAGTTTNEIRVCYRRLAWEYHPDRGKYTGAGEVPIFTAIQQAYAVLRDPISRAKYDAEQALRNTACSHCTKGAKYVQQGYNRRTAIVCLACGGSGYRTVEAKV